MAPLSISRVIYYILLHLCTLCLSADPHSSPWRHHGCHPVCGPNQHQGGCPEWRYRRGSVYPLWYVVLPFNLALNKKGLIPVTRLTLFLAPTLNIFLFLKLFWICLFWFWFFCILLMWRTFFLSYPAFQKHVTLIKHVFFRPYYYWFALDRALQTCWSF